ncbi:hypothetical protein GCM10017655_29070 [Pseudomonas turukhanskensis]|uniref:Uncharacterized protein n=1 Tax=Pseudomonas turukhanskensis TaxID=1806536 RepID=A0A9W6NGI0_9PSED|nr:hypothetical protein GCM10017655_29070 [Pseudomonas turukhanskensis]
MLQEDDWTLQAVASTADFMNAKTVSRLQLLQLLPDCGSTDTQCTPESLTRLKLPVL